MTLFKKGTLNWPNFSFPSKPRLSVINACTNNFFPPLFFFLINIYVCIYILYLYVQSKTHLREDPRSSIKFLFSIYRLIRGKKIYSVTIYDEYYDTLTSQKFGDMFVDRHVHGFKRNLHTFIFILFFFLLFLFILTISWKAFIKVIILLRVDLCPISRGFLFFRIIVREILRSLFKRIILIFFFIF